MSSAEKNVADPVYAKTLADLRNLDEKELVRLHDLLVAGGQTIREEYYLAELARRDAEKREKTMVRLTYVIAALTVVNVVAVVLSVA